MYSALRSFLINNLSSSDKKTLHFQKNNYPCPIIEIAPEYLIYRVTNTRTKSKQKEYIQDNNKHDDYFSDDRIEVEEVQYSQHEILQTEVDEILKKAYDMQGGQTESILINKDGIVINGNRRLCLMRDNEETLIKCQVITDPNLEGKDAEIEAWIDIAPTAKRDYIWHAVGLSMIELSDQGYDNEKIAEMKGFPTAREVDIRMQAVKLAEEQLIWQGTKDKWSIVDKAQQTYEDSVAKKYSGPRDRRAAELFTIALNIATDDAAGTRRYEPNKKAINNIEVVREYFEEIAGTEEQIENSFSDEVETSIQIDEEKIKNIITNPTEVDELVEQVIERLDENEEKKAGAGKRKLLQKKIIAAAKALNAAKDLTDEAGYETEGIKEKINEINESISKIEDYIEH